MSAEPKSVSLPNDKRHLGEGADRMVKIGTALAVLGLGGATAFAFARGEGFGGFFHAYLTSYLYFLSLSIGGMFFVLFQHVFKGAWSVAVRRIAEWVMATMPILAVFSLVILIPVALGDHSLFPWTDPHYVEHHEIVKHKQFYLNVPRLLGCSVAYFVIWILMSRFYFRNSVDQDEDGDVEHTKKMEKWGPVGLIVLAITTSFFSFDFLMSLAPAWFSTMFGVYFFAGSFISFLSLHALMALWLQKNRYLENTITTEHLHDLGKLMFAFVFFWGYIAYSQYMLIWYGNLPEETHYFHIRQHHGWEWVSVALLIGHLVLPFPGLLSRHIKRNRKALGFWAVWLLIFHWVDLYWQVWPNAYEEGVPFGLMDILAFVGMAGVFVAALGRRGRGISLVPEKDPRLGESLAFENY